MIAAIVTVALVAAEIWWAARFDLELQNDVCTRVLHTPDVQRDRPVA
ncbi:hypothetical protein [Curtobacterium sp. 20TX0008]|nr:hypothetical protein [Curtobacterium sp. 20TX0008]MDB6425910.1 hypothetical protein [Curtobacterium sp. 20TX0008]